MHYRAVAFFLYMLLLYVLQSTLGFTNSNFYSVSVDSLISQVQYMNTVIGTQQQTNVSVIKPRSDKSVDYLIAFHYFLLHLPYSSIFAYSLHSYGQLARTANSCNWNDRCVQSAVAAQPTQSKNCSHGQQSPSLRTQATSCYDLSVPNCRYYWLY